MENVALFASFTVSSRTRSPKGGPERDLTMRLCYHERGKENRRRMLRGRPDHVPIVHCVIPNSFAKGGRERDLTMRLRHHERGKVDHRRMRCEGDLITSILQRVIPNSFAERRMREGPYDAIASSRTWKGKLAAHALRERPDHVQAAVHASYGPSPALLRRAGSG